VQTWHVNTYCMQTRSGARRVCGIHCDLQPFLGGYHAQTKKKTKCT
jgi:hypothetical protein